MQEACKNVQVYFLYINQILIFLIQTVWFLIVKNIYKNYVKRYVKRMENLGENVYKVGLSQKGDLLANHAEISEIDFYNCRLIQLNAIIPRLPQIIRA